MWDNWDDHTRELLRKGRDGKRVPVERWAQEILLTQPDQPPSRSIDTVRYTYEDLEDLEQLGRRLPASCPTCRRYGMEYREQERTVFNDGSVLRWWTECGHIRRDYTEVTRRQKEVRSIRLQQQLQQHLQEHQENRPAAKVSPRKKRWWQFWRGETFAAYGIGDTEGPAVIGEYSVQDLQESVAGPQGTKTYDEAVAWNHGQAEGEPSYSPSVKSEVGVLPMMNRNMMMSVGVLVGAVAVGFYFDQIRDRVMSLFGKTESEESGAEYDMGQVNFSGGGSDAGATQGQSLKSANETSARVKYDYNPVAGPTQMAHDPRTMPQDTFSFE